MAERAGLTKRHQKCAGSVGPPPVTTRAQGTLEQHRDSDPHLGSLLTQRSECRADNLHLWRIGAAGGGLERQRFPEELKPRCCIF